MHLTVQYCSGCNELFQLQPDIADCPLCGQDLVSADTISTIHDEITDREIYNQPSDDSPDLCEQLVGKDLSAYHIESFAGRGGMAWVFRATHRTLQRPCAVKVLCPRLAQRNKSVIDQFLIEARAAASLVHPHIVAVHNISYVDPYHLIELEYVDGKSLQKILKSKGRLDPLEATEFMVQMCHALGAAHGLGMVHRDFKPANVLVSNKGLAKLSDFGLAKNLLSDKGDPDRNRSSGTPYYMAPELFTGAGASRQSDVYAVGIAYYQLLTGDVPFKDLKMPGLVEKHATLPMPDPRATVSAVPAGAVDVLKRCLAKNPSDRFADAVALHGELRAVLGNLRDLRSLVREAFHGLTVELVESGKSYAAKVRLPHNRTQTVHIETSSKGLNAAGLVRIYSICCPEEQSYYRRALELNSKIAHGSLAIQEIDGKSCFVMINSYPRSTCDPEEIRQSVLTIAKWADEVERTLNTKDSH